MHVCERDIRSKESVRDLEPDMYKLERERACVCEE